MNDNNDGITIEKWCPRDTFEDITFGQEILIGIVFTGAILSTILQGRIADTILVAGAVLIFLNQDSLAEAFYNLWPQDTQQIDDDDDSTDDDTTDSDIQIEETRGTKTSEIEECNEEKTDNKDSDNNSSSADEKTINEFKVI